MEDDGDRLLTFWDEGFELVDCEAVILVPHLCREDWSACVVVRCLRKRCSKEGKKRKGDEVLHVVY